MTSKNRMKFGDLDLSVIDPHKRDTEYIYEEIFDRKIYEHDKFRVASTGATILDVGANIGLYSIWASRRDKPSAIFAYEASPVTYGYLADNVGRHIDQAACKVHCVNRAVSSQPGRELVLSQAPFTSGLSTLLDETSVPWVGELRRSGELVSHKTVTTTVSEEMAKHGIDRVDILKIDVEGHFMEVLAGIAPNDFKKIANIVLEAEYLAALGLTEGKVRAHLDAVGYATEAQDLTIYAWRDA